MAVFILSEVVCRVAVAGEPAINGVQKWLLVGPQTVECEGGGSRECLLVKSHPDDRWTLLHIPINDFEFESGFEYELIVAESNTMNNESARFRRRIDLVEIVQKTPATPLEDTIWWITSMGNVESSWENDTAGGTVIFDSATGHVYGRAPCNLYSFEEEYSRDWRTLTMPSKNSVAMTLMLCAGMIPIDYLRLTAAEIQFLEMNDAFALMSYDYMSLDGMLISALAEAHSFEIWNGKLRIFYADDQVMKLVAVQEA